MVLDYYGRTTSGRLSRMSQNAFFDIAKLQNNFHITKYFRNFF